MNDADAYAAADLQFEYDQERERDRRHAPIIRRDYPISDESRRLGEQDAKDAQELYKQSGINAEEWLREWLELRLQRDEEYYELQDVRRQYPPVPLCDTLINEDTL